MASLVADVRHEIADVSPSTVTLMGMIARRGVGRGIHAPALKMTRWIVVISDPDVYCGSCEEASLCCDELPAGTESRPPSSSPTPHHTGARLNPASPRPNSSPR